MALDKTQVLKGVGRLYTAPIGTIIPDDFDAPEAPWADVGHTTGGVEFVYNIDENEIESDQVLDPLDVEDGKRTATVATTLMQVRNAANLQLAFGGGTITAVDPDAVPDSGDEYDEYDPPDAGEGTRIMLLFDGTNPSDAKIRLICFECKRTGGSSVRFAKGAAATLPVTWRMLEPASGGKPFRARTKKA
jgi:hypothetical protein